MEILHTTSRKRQTYQVQLEHSMLWESALAIAAITNTRLLETLDESSIYWNTEIFSTELQAQLNYVEKHNTWKAILQLLHKKPFENHEEFQIYIKELSEMEIRFNCIPFIGGEFQQIRTTAAKGDIEAQSALQEETKDNPFFPDYIHYICTVEIQELKEHLCAVMARWNEEVIRHDYAKISSVLNRDYEDKKNMLANLHPEEFVRWATGGIEYSPEPSVHHVLLIPQISYRPWNIVADLEDTKVFYYPVANESITPEDRFTPDQFLVLRYKALGDEVRLKLVKMLVEKEQTLQELTERLDVGKSTIHHHLKILRSARLVEVNASTYRIKQDALNALQSELIRFLER